MNRPPPGSMCYWKAKGDINWHFGYCTYLDSPHLIRMGRWDGDNYGGSVVSVNDIEWRKYQ